MKKAKLFLLVLLAIGCKQKDKEANKEANKEEPMSETAENTDEEAWQVLFDGTSFEGWHFYNGGEVGEPWKLEEGAMVFYPPEERPEGASYNIVTDEEFTNFELSLVQCW